jgi:hypothetical protein
MNEGSAAATVRRVTLLNSGSGRAEDLAAAPALEFSRGSAIRGDAGDSGGCRNRELA